MGLSDLFVDPGSLPDGGYGLIQLSTLLFGYGYVLFVASNMISDGSELLLLVPSIAGLVGSCVLPVLGAVPDGMIVLFSGMGPNAQEQLDVGVGALAGSTVMLITIPWVLSVYAGRVDIEDGKCKYTKKGKLAQGALTGVQSSAGVKKGGYVMMLTSLSYILLQGPAQYFGSKNEDTEEVAAGEKTFALVGLFVTLGMFFGYLYYQYLMALGENDEVAEKVRTEMTIKTIEDGRVTLRGAVHYELLQFEAAIGSPLADQGAPGYQAVSTSANDVWNKLPPHAKGRFSAIIKSFWRKFVKPGEDVGVPVASLGQMFHSMNENLTPEEIDSIFKQFDKDGNGAVDLEEFIMGTVQYLWTHKHRIDIKTESDELVKHHSTSATLDDEEDEEEEEEEMPDELKDLEPAEQQRRLLSMALTTMGLGTALVVLFSDPMTDVLGEVGKRTGIPAFYVAFVIAPLASNASELIASYSYALKKTPKSISISLQALQGAACMNNTFCLSIFMALIYFQGLAWEFSAETIAIVVCQIGVAVASTQENQTLFSAWCVFMLYPLCLALVATLEAMGFD